ncbi:neutral/alkaline non-lysosomal ceramidase N-terminal domain-containing protein [Candidatus Laterigemmans baculatus]|uniref:neutral/alkaline non-lysosomal ceramidase N-terminal domain-containing protein n=1 Tax=Candidatus Laterigemmans baculatus TaxID=2770505 RepID=UPI0013DC60B0|nr:neutral/alkaline non-lysosomal ceramidase N-terminal domain-containing protein [Candidatus Laterigemmans baculatus]
MIDRILPCWCRTFASLLTLVVVFTATAEAEWKAGVAEANITPTEPMWMSGYGSRNHPAEGKLTDLWAKALVMEDSEGHRAVLVTLDLVGIDRGISQRVGAALEERYGLPRRSVALSTSHTHSGPVVGENLSAMYDLDQQGWKLVSEYTSRLEQQIVETVGKAIENLAPADLAWTVGRAHFAVNRRNNTEAKVPELREAGQLQGPVDHDVPVLVVRRGGDKTLAIVAGYACHATVLSGYQWCGDWPGYAQMEIEARHPDAVAMVWAGCGADQNPLPRRQVAHAEGYGNQIADAVDAALAQPLQPIEGSLKTVYAEIPLPLSEIPDREELMRQLKEGNRFEIGRARQLLEELDEKGELSETYPYPVQTWRLGDGPLFVFLGGEVVVDYALRLKAELGAGATWVAGYSNDVMAYIPSLRVLREGGYEGGGSMVYYGLPSPWSEEVEEMVVAEVRRQVAEVGGPPADKFSSLPARPYPDHSDLTVYLDDQNQLQPIDSAEDWAQRREDILVGMQHAMGRLPQPSELEPLDVEEVSRDEGPGYSRLKITYRVDSGPRTTAHLYLPNDLEPGQRRPGILALHPTSPLGKGIVAGEGPLPNRNYAVELAQRGYVVLAPDYPSFGDDADYNFHLDPYVSGSMKGIVNHMRGVDLLSAREDVDPKRIGVIGHSLGGHNAMFVGVFDPRIAAVVSSCGWTPFAEYYEGKIAGWTSDRYMPRLREIYGLDPAAVPFDFYEVAAAIAPRGFFSCSPVRDSNFEVAGVKKAEPKIRQVYSLLDAEENFVVRYPEAEHDFPTETRMESYEFLDRVLDHEPTK